MKTFNIMRFGKQEICEFYGMVVELYSGRGAGLNPEAAVKFSGGNNMTSDSSDRFDFFRRGLADLQNLVRASLSPPKLSFDSKIRHSIQQKFCIKSF